MIGTDLGSLRTGICFSECRRVRCTAARRLAGRHSGVILPAQVRVGKLRLQGLRRGLGRMGPMTDRCRIAGPLIPRRHFQADRRRRDAESRGRSGLRPLWPWSRWLRSEPDGSCGTIRLNRQRLPRRPPPIRGRLLRDRRRKRLKCRTPSRLSLLHCQTNRRRIFHYWSQSRYHCRLSRPRFLRSGQKISLWARRSRRRPVPIGAS